LESVRLFVTRSVLVTNSLDGSAHGRVLLGVRHRVTVSQRRGFTCRESWRYRPLSALRRTCVTSHEKRVCGGAHDATHRRATWRVRGARTRNWCEGSAVGWGGLWAAI